MKKLIILILCFVSVMGLMAEELPIVTVMDFSSENVAANEMKSIISLISSALFRSGAYTVIDISQRESILQ